MIRPLRPLLALLLLMPDARAEGKLTERTRRGLAAEHPVKPAGVAEDEDFVDLPRSIIGGNEADLEDHPWMAALVRTGEGAYEGSFCGGSLVHPWWILTAAHCVADLTAGEIEIVIGTDDLNDLSGGRRIPVAEVIVHPDYNANTSDSDLALLRLAEAAPPGSVTLPLIDTASLEAPGLMAKVAGWGDTTNGDGVYPAQLREVEVPLVALATANATPAYSGSLTGNMLAAGFAAGGKDSCFGDSGGPLIVRSTVGPGWMQAGVVSFGDGNCAAPNAYGIYVRVSRFRDFVLSHLWPNYSRDERTSGRVGELRDSDGDGRTLWDDFALPGGRTAVVPSETGAEFSFLRPRDADEVSYAIERSEDLSGPWSAVGIDPEAAARTEVEGGLEWWKVSSPDSPVAGDFLRLVTGYSGDLAKGPRLLKAPGSAGGALDPTDASSSDGSGFLARDYELTGLTAGAVHAVSLRSREFDARMELRNEAEEILMSADSDSGLGKTGHDESLSFTPQPDTAYFLHVTSHQPAESGSYELGVRLAAAHNSLTLIRPGATTTGALVSSDPPDPLYQPGGHYYKDDYRLDVSTVAPGSVVEVFMHAVSSFDAFLSLIDAETGKWITSTDDIGTSDFDAKLRFVPVPGKSYLIRATSAEERETGSYSVRPSLNPVAVPSLALAGPKTGSFNSASEVDSDRSFKRDHLLDAGGVGETVRINMSSAAIDSYLEVYEASTWRRVASDDDSGGGLNSSLTFVPEAGCRYFVRAVSLVFGEVGSYTLAVAILP